MSNHSVISTADAVRGALGIAVGAAAAWLAAALITWHADDPGLMNSGISGASIHNLMGLSGAWAADALYAVFGLVAWLCPLLLIGLALSLFHLGARVDWDRRVALRVGGVVIWLLGAVTLASVHGARAGWPAGAGGITGDLLQWYLLPLLNLWGVTLFGIAAVLAGVGITFNLSWMGVLEVLGAAVVASGSNLAVGLRQRYRRLLQGRAEQSTAEQNRQQRREQVLHEQRRVEGRPPPKIIPETTEIVESERSRRDRQKPLPMPEAAPVTEFPSLELLETGDDDQRSGFSAESLEAMSRLLEIKLKDFKVTAEVVSVLPGPVVTRFELQLAAGIKVSRVTALVKDLARSLAVVSVRVVEVIPGKPLVGIEVPNEQRDTVRFRSIIGSEAFEKSTSPLTLALGHDIGGEAMVADLARMPHLLVAGTTGSGKSVGVNAMLLSILYRAEPSQVRLILVDPKMLELSVYEGIPHLLTPVVTDMKEAAGALRWCVVEMDRRYRVLAAQGVRNLGGFNRKVEDQQRAGEPLCDPETGEPLETLPFIVIVIDEFADMMMIVGKKVEELIARIAQKARAAGIHLVLATQRPSVDVITGLIKANVPTRMSFQVSSRIDSRTILDQGGAEQLLGHGDMLYLPPGTSVPVRVHGAFVSDEEVHRVVADWRARGEPDYVAGVLEQPEPMAAGDRADPEEADPLYDEAVAFVLETRRVSISSVQRKLRIGYNRAARLVEAMEAAGMVSSMDSSGSREVLVPGGSEL